MKADFPDRIVHQHLRDSCLAADADQHFGQLRLEVQTRIFGQAQSDHETNLRQAAEMENGRGRNIHAIA